MYIEAIANMMWNHEYCAIRQYYVHQQMGGETQLYRVPLRSSSRSSLTMASSSSSSSISCNALAGISPASTAARSAWYRGESFFDGCVVTIGLAPRSSSPASARPCVAARVVQYAMAINVNRPPRTTVPVRAPAYFVSGLHVACVWFPTADMIRYVQPYLIAPTQSVGQPLGQLGGRRGR